MKSFLFRRIGFTAKWPLAAAALALTGWAATTLRAQSIIVDEDGVGANQIVNISSSTLGNNLEVYASAIDMLVDGLQTQGFCIDPWHWSVEGQLMTYTSESLASGPKSPAPMGAGVALEIEQLWQEYYSPTMSNSDAAGLQIAIWDLVSVSVEAATDGASWYTLNSGDDYGASAMVAWVESDPTAAAANLVAITGPGQDYVVQESVLPSATINAAATAYTGSPFNATSVATAPDANLTLHSIEWLSPAGAWTVDTAAAQGASDNLAVGINFPAIGLWTLRAGTSVDNGNTWVYSPEVTVAVSSGLATYTLASMSVPSLSGQLWYTPSAVAQKTYEVQRVNP